MVLCSDWVPSGDTWKLCVHFEYKNCTRCIQLMYTKCIQNVCKMYTTFWQAFMYILYTISKELCQLNFVYKMYTDILYTFCIHQFWSTKSVHHKHYVYSLYTNFIQNVYTNNCMQNGSLISIYFDPFVVHFLVNHCKQLTLETCWLFTGSTYQIDGLLDYTLN